MILAVDVQYSGDTGYCGGVLFDDWKASIPTNEFGIKYEKVSKYVPGEFYKRELPCILKLLSSYSLSPDIIIIDGFVYLDGHKIAGLGKHLFEALDQSVSVFGVAKSGYAGISDEFAVFRGRSKRPLYVTSCGPDIEGAKLKVTNMHGKYRIPTLLRTVDKLARTLASR